MMFRRHAEWIQRHAGCILYVCVRERERERKREGAFRCSGAQWFSQSCLVWGKLQSRLHFWCWHFVFPRKEERSHGSKRLRKKWEAGSVASPGGSGDLSSSDVSDPWGWKYNPSCDIFKSSLYSSKARIPLQAIKATKVLNPPYVWPEFSWRSWRLWLLAGALLLWAAF